MATAPAAAVDDGVMSEAPGERLVVTSGSNPTLSARPSAVDDGIPQQEVAAAQADERRRLWKRNERLVYLTNFVHMTMMTLCMGGVWDIFLYRVSEQQQALQIDMISVGQSVTPTSPIELETFSSFELVFDIRPARTQPPAPEGCMSNWTCDAVILHITDGHGNGDCCHVGNRVPALFFRNGTTKLHVMMDSPEQPQTMNRKTYDLSQMCWSQGELEPGVWSSIKVKQSDATSSKGKYGSKDGALVLFVNGMKACEINGTKAGQVQPIRNALMFFGALQGPRFHDPHVTANFEIRNVKYGKPASNVFVGTVNSLQGLIAVVIMYPIGWLGDRTNRYVLLRWNLVMGVLAAVVLVLGVHWSSSAFLFIGVGLFAAYQQCLSSTIYAALADNVVKGRRGRAANHYKTLTALAMAFGPAIQFGVIYLGPAPDAWTSKAFDVLLLPGWTLMILVAIVVFGFRPVGTRVSDIPNADEAPALLESSRSLTRNGGSAPLLLAMGSASPPVLGARMVSKRRVSSRLTDSWLDEEVAGPLKLRRRFAVALSTQVFFIGTLMANGMTVKYFSLYYTQVLKLTPAGLCILNAICRLWIAGFVQVVSPLSKWCGRGNVVVIFHLLAAIFTLGIYGGGMVNVPPLWLSCSCYLLRYGFLQARDPLLYSITMDIVPESQRSRWAALNSFRTLSFSGSALVGGYLADLYGYEVSFQVTVIALIVSTALFLPAWLYFPRQESRLENYADTEDCHGSATSTHREVDGSLREECDHLSCASANARCEEGTHQCSGGSQGVQR